MKSSMPIRCNEKYHDWLIFCNLHNTTSSMHSQGTWLTPPQLVDGYILVLNSYELWCTYGLSRNWHSKLYFMLEWNGETTAVPLIHYYMPTLLNCQTMTWRIFGSLMLQNMVKYIWLNLRTTVGQIALKGWGCVSMSLQHKCFGRPSSKQTFHMTGLTWLLS